MMAEPNASDGYRKLRSVFSDVTNQLGKRKSSEKETYGIKSNNFKNQDRVKQARVLPRLRTEINSLKGNVISSISKVPNENEDTDALDICKDSAIFKSTAEVEIVSKDSCVGDGSKKMKNVKMCSSESHEENKDSKILDPDVADLCVGRAVNHIENEADVSDEVDSSKENVIPGFPIIDSEKKCSRLIDTGSGRVAEVILSNLGDGAMSSSKVSSKNENLNCLDLDKRNGLHGINVEATLELVDSIVTKISVPNSETGGDSVCDGKNCNNDEAKVISEGTTESGTDRQTYGDDDNVDSLVLSQSGSIDCNVLPESQESRVLGLQRCTGLKMGDALANRSGEIDLLKSCSCSFCTKAAYIWLDLHYQDSKARISAIKKSQKEASILAARSCRSKETEKHGLGNSSSVSKLEFDLMHQWRHLFQHMVDTCEHESNQLETNLLPLLELREQCRTDLEHINASSSEKH